MSNKHTPGPWVLGENWRGKLAVHAGSLDGPRVCNGPRGEDGSGVANLRLIAAAPCLLAACEVMLADVASYLARGGTLTDKEAAHVSQMRAAVALARGAAPLEAEDDEEG